MKHLRLLACAILLLAGSAHAQDARTVVSPDGQLEFRLFTRVPEGNTLNSLAYQVWRRGRLLLDTSYLGLNIHFQEPLLGENVGLSSDKKLSGGHYNGLWADYLQTSTTGRRIQLEVRVWNDGVAFRYTIPPSALLMDFLLEDDATEFHFAQDAVDGRPARAEMPYAEQEADGEWIGISELGVAGVPATQLLRANAHSLVTHLPDKPHDPNVAFEGKTPWVSPWRMIAVTGDRAGLGKTLMGRELNGE